jgi:predicted short-subunit dehydrogenase-like oxidoreductase (DUF2520 family)
MTFNIIGTGNTAWFLTTRLTAAGHQCKGVYGRSAGKATELAKSIDSDIYTSLEAISDDADCTIVAISDNAIPEVAGKLSLNKSVLLHTAGSVAMNIFEGHATNMAVLWPIYSIVKTDIPLHRNIPFVYEGNTKAAIETVQALAMAISDICHELNSEQRAWLHLTAVLGNNFTNHLMSLCEGLCKEQHIPFDLLRPILQQTFSRMLHQSPEDLQTGPAKRGDIITMQKHINLLAGKPHISSVYKALSASIENMYRVNAEEKA